MDITPLVPADRQLINGYGDGGFTITGQRHEGSVLVFPDRTLAWPAADAGAITPDTLAAVFEPDLRPDILLVGCGRTMTPLPAAVRNHFRARGVVIDLMDTGAACRTYNVLLTEGRKVAAALIAV